MNEPILTKIKRAIATTRPFVINFYSVQPKDYIVIDSILHLFLKEVDLENFADSLSFCLRELIGNAQKANLKRVYFKEQRLDLYDTNEYEKGIKAFRKEIINKMDSHLPKLKAYDYKIHLGIQVRSDTLMIQVSNNAAPTGEEKKRISSRIIEAEKCNSVEEVLEKVLDNTEGAGLGVLMIVTILKKLGLSEKALQIRINHDTTSMYIVIPISETRTKGINIAITKFAESVDNLPQFSDKIIAVISLIRSEESSNSEIAQEISRDPALTAEVLKEINSAIYSLPRHISSLDEAVSYIGRKKLEVLLYTVQAKSVFTGEELWNHSYNVGVTAYELAKEISQEGFSEDAYIGGILHDIGKFIFININESFHKKMIRLSEERHVSSKIVEEVVSGLNHAELGARIMERWNFPQKLIDSTRYHHDPLQQTSPHKQLIRVIYLADAIEQWKRGSINYDEIDARVLNLFGLETEEKLKRWCEETGVTESKEEDQ